MTLEHTKEFHSRNASPPTISSIKRTPSLTPALVVCCAGRLVEAVVSTATEPLVVLVDELVVDPAAEALAEVGKADAVYAGVKDEAALEYEYDVEVEDDGLEDAVYCEDVDEEVDATTTMLVLAEDSLTAADEKLVDEGGGAIVLKEAVAPQSSNDVPLGQHPAVVQ